MNFPFYIAKRYLFSKKKTNVINLISGISMLGVAVATMAMVVTLSAFNGFSDLVATLFTSFDPELKVTPVEGKTTWADDPALESMRKLPQVEVATDCLEDQALVVYGDRQAMVMLKGVDRNFEQLTNIDDILELPDVKERVDLYFKEAEAFKEQLKRIAKVYDKVVVLDLRNEEVIHAGNRFMIYALYPETTISVHVAWGFRKQNTAVMIGKSIFNKSSKVDIGELCLRYGGGGHHNAGTCQLENDVVDAELPAIIDALKRAYKKAPHAALRRLFCLLAGYFLVLHARTPATSFSPSLSCTEAILSVTGFASPRIIRR